MQIATVAQVKNQLSRYLTRARQRREPIVVTHHGKPYALIQPISEKDLDMLDWKRLAEKRLRDAWAGEDDALYDDLLGRVRSSSSRCPSPISPARSDGRRSS